jgi:uncharacterized damage-inducible protein DinB
MPLSTSVTGRLKQQHEIISSWILQYSEDQLKHRINPAKWSAFENIVHIVSYQPVFIQRIEAILKNEQPSFAAYKADNDPLFLEYLNKNLRELEQDLYKNRQIIVGKLLAAGDDTLQYWGIHPRFGKISLADWCEFFLLHEAHHLFTTFTLIRQA